MTKQAYTIQDVINAGYTLEPIQCFKCKSTKHVVSLMNSCGDCKCEWCGAWQIADNPKYKNKTL